MNQQLAQDKHGLKRELGVWSAAAIVVGTVIGSGIFLVPSTMIRNVGSPLKVFLVWIAGGLLSLFGALSYAELAAAMPEAGYLPIPKKLAQKGVKDMIRISDARMSGTAFGTIVLHVTPDAASGGPLGLVRNGDRIRLSVKNRSIALLVDDAELKKRAASAKLQTKIPERGYAKLFAEQITGANEGCDFKFLMPR